MNKKRNIVGWILTALLFVVAFITVVPFIWMLISSFAPNSEIVKVTGGLFPTPSSVENYVNIQEKFNFLRLFANSLFVAGLKTVIAIYTSAVLGFVFSKMHFRGISDELIEAAKLDGASDTRIFHSIILPMSHNTIAALAIFTFLWNWEDYLWPFLMVTDENKQLLAVGLKAFNGQYGTDYGGLFAATSLAIVPVIVVYMIFQKQFIAGIATGSGK